MPRFTSRDGSFGFLVEAMDGTRFFTFQLIIGGELLGDREPCILGTAVNQLQNLVAVGLDQRSFATKDEAFKALSELKTRDDWNDATLRPLAESLDRWDVRGFSQESSAVFLALPDADSCSIKVAVVDLDEYQSLVKSLADYWRSAGG